MSIKIEGLTKTEVLALSDEQMRELVFHGEPVVLKAGSADVLGAFKLSDTSLNIELAQIDGGGEGVLIALALLAKKFASRYQCETIQWTVHAVDCANPNLKLRRVLERRGFVIRPVGGNLAYSLIETV